MGYSTIQFDERDGAFRLTLNRPDRLNAFTQQMHEEVADALGQIEAATRPRALLVTGAGRGFCAGQDLGERDVSAGPVDLGCGPDLYYNPLIRRLTRLTIPVLCAVNGAAAGAGVGIALAADIVIAKRSAKFVQAFSAIGMSPDSGVTWTLPRVVGQANALAISLLGETLSADDARAIGLIWKAVDDADFASEVEVIFQKLATGPTIGLASTKRAIRAAWSSTLDEALDRERDLLSAIGRSADYREGVTAFKEKRPPQFKSE